VGLIDFKNGLFQIGNSDHPAGRLMMKHPLDDPKSREATIVLRAELRQNFRRLAEADQYVIDLDFGILGEWLDVSERCHQIEAGEVRLRLVRLSVALEAEAPLDELFDLDQSMANLGGLYDGFSINLDFHREIHEVCGEANSFSDLFSVESIFLEPWARRQGVGLRVIEMLLQNWQSGCSLAVINPRPFGRPADRDGEARLTRYFGQLGFKQVPGIPHLVRSIEMKPPNKAHVDLPDVLLVPSQMAEKLENKG
jgi:hypothetical protein